MAEPPKLKPKEIEEKKEVLQEELGELRVELNRLVHRIDLNRPADPTDVAVAPALPEHLGEAEDLLSAIEAEIKRIDELLAHVAKREREIRTKGFAALGEPYRSAEFTLYARLVPTKSGETYVKYFFAEEPPINAVAVPLPDGYEVEIDEKNGKRSLRRSLSTPSQGATDAKGT